MVMIPSEISLRRLGWGVASVISLSAVAGILVANALRKNRLSCHEKSPDRCRPGPFRDDIGNQNEIVRSMP
jgi:hypothetical protein